jgi:hypothetical protein
VELFHSQSFLTPEIMAFPILHCAVFQGEASVLIFDFTLMFVLDSRLCNFRLLYLVAFGTLWDETIVAVDD